MRSYTGKKEMKKKILIFGAGSIGNHMTNANLKLNNIVYITDIDHNALIRMKTKIFPERYGKWNNSINIIKYNDAFKKKFFELIIIGTPPKTHIKLFNKIFESNLKFKKILIEKPLSSYMEKFEQLERYNKSNIFVGYNHSVSKSFNYFFKHIKKDKSKLNNIIINWKESFQGILGAHKWLKNEFDSYLGYSKFGGGAIHEHSHALHLAHVIIEELKLKITRTKFYKLFYENNKNLYDNLSNIFFESLKTNIKLEIDLLTFPAEKKIDAFTKNKKISWIYNYKKGADAVIFKNKKGKEKIKLFFKNRSTEYENEIKHILSIKNLKKYNNSRLNISYGILVMRTIKSFFYDKRKNI